MADAGIEMIVSFDRGQRFVGDAGIVCHQDIDRIADGVQQEEDDPADAEYQHHREQQSSNQITQDAHRTNLIERYAR